MRAQDAMQKVRWCRCQPGTMKAMPFIVLGQTSYAVKIPLSNMRAASHENWATQLGH